jgi:predicted RNA polymerase sigma factor
VEVPADPQEVGTVDQADDSLALYFLCAHPSLSPASATALTLRAVGGLTTAQIATAFLVPETTMAQRISRAKRSLRDVRLGRSGDIRVVLRVLYLVFNEGFTGDVDLAEEAIRITRMLRVRYDHEEVSGLLSLMLLHHARRAARLSADGVLVPLPEQDRSRWDTAVIGEGVGILQEALARDRRGPYQVQAAIAALHDDARTAAETDWPQILDWYDDLLGLEDTPVVRLNRIVALAEVHGADAGLEELATLDPRLPRFTAVEAHLRERNGEMTCAAELFSQASREARNVPEREHLRERAHRAADAAVAADRAGSRVHS